MYVRGEGGALKALSGEEKSYVETEKKNSQSSSRNKDQIWL